MPTLYLILRSSDPLQYFAFILLFIGITLISWLFSRQMIVRSALRKRGAKRIKDFKDGDNGKVTGRVVLAGETLVAPLSGRRCSYYHVKVVHYHNKSHSTIVEEAKKGDVVLYDGSHYALVDTRNTKTYLVPDAKYSSGTFNDATPELEEFLRQHGHKSTDFFGFNKSFSYQEGVLEAGEIFTVSGQGYWNETKDHGLKINSERVLVITTGEFEQLVYISDDPQAAQTND